MKNLKIKRDMAKLYNKKLDLLSKNIWDIIDSIDYYRYIRYIMMRIKINEDITKWDAIKLYNFIMGFADEYIPRNELDEKYDKIKDKLFIGGINNDINKK